MATPAQRLILISLLLTSPQLSRAEDEQKDRERAQAAAAAGAALAGAQAAMHAAAAAKARAEQDQAKAAEETAKMAAQLAQMAANLAAMGGNKKGKEQAKAADPAKAPEVAKAAAEKAAAKETPKMEASAPAESPTEVAAAEPETQAVPSALVDQVAANSPDEVAPEVFDRNFDAGDIPDSIPRAKIGYDESNPTGGAAPANAASDKLAMGSMDGRAATNATPAGGRLAKVGEHGAAESGGSDGEDGTTASSSGGDGTAKADFKSMLGAILGAKDETTVAAGGNGVKDLSALKAGQKPRHPQLADTGVRNIFQYASQKYEWIAREEAFPPSKARRNKPSYIANVGNVK